jgi:thioredoxin reductase (NADPH)
MITTDDLAKAPLFADLDHDTLDFIARNVADIHLVSGEYVVHEGDERALFVIIAGHFEVTKMVDGVERVLGPRTVGGIFGEVPMTLGSMFPAAMRATEPSRILRLDSHVFHSLCARAPHISTKVGVIAQSRIEGLRQVTSAPAEPELVVIGPRWDSCVHELRSFLTGNLVPYEWLTPEEDAGTDEAPAPPAEGYPIVRLPDGTEMFSPTRRRVAQALGLTVAPSRADYDVVIIGGGPAGLAAAVYGVSEGLSTLLVERMSPGGQAGTSSRIENYLGFPYGLSGDELAGRALSQARRLGAEVLVTRSVEAIDPTERTITLDGGESVEARGVILSMGVSWRSLSVEGLERLTGSGVYYGAARSEATSTQGKDVFLIGAGNSSGQAALFFANHARSVTLLCRGDDLAKSMSYYLIEQLKTKDNVIVELRAEVAAVHGEKHLQAIDVANHATGETTRRDATALFILIGADAVTDWLPPEIARDDNGYVVSGADARRTGAWPMERDPFLLETSVPGVFAVGDVRAGSVKRIASGVGEGSMAIAFVHKYLHEG